jgi:SAM-dependent methyltransferase
VTTKSSTDTFWNTRAGSGLDVRKVNISDTVQRDFELKFIFENLLAGSRVLEVGCGNGYVSQQIRDKVAHLDAFDYAENMVEAAKKAYGEKNNRFFHDSVLAPKNLKGPYDAALCVRVLINLRDVEEQKLAVRNIANALRPGGRLILIEGYRDGFEEVSKLRQSVGLPALAPAKINFYSRLSDLLPAITEQFVIERTWHSGVFDFLTRIILPQLVGAEKASEGSEFHTKIEPVLHAFQGPDMANLARLHGFVLSRR